jgi:small subunit ribosomal protein S16
VRTTDAPAASRDGGRGRGSGDASSRRNDGGQSTRTGGKNDACYRIVAADGRSPRDGQCLDILGWYDPKRDGVKFELKMDRVEYWRGRGAQFSDTVRSLIRSARKAAG